MFDAIMDSHYIRSFQAIFPEGLILTIGITLAGLFFGFIIGAIVGLGRLSKKKIINIPSLWFVEIVRGTPMLAQILFIYSGLTEDIIGFNIGALPTAIIAIAINAGAYIAEIVRGTVHSIDKGQREAGRALGLSERETMRLIIWPQAFKRMIPPLGNQFVISLKDTSLFSVIAIGELLYLGKQYYNITYSPFQTLIVVCFLYLCITIPASFFLRRLERKLDV